jgi:hypothetical protein
MTEELMVRILMGIENYKRVNGGPASMTDLQFAENFIRATAFSPSNSGFRFRSIRGWRIVEINDDFEGPPFTLHDADSKEEAEKKLQEIYPGGVGEELLPYLCYETDIEFQPVVGVKEKSQVSLSEMSDQDAINQIVLNHATNITATMTDIKNHIKGAKETGHLNETNPKTLKSAIKQVENLQLELEEKRAEQLQELVVNRGGKRHLLTKKEWTSSEVQDYPDLSTKIEIAKPKNIQYSVLLALDRFLSNSLGVSVASVLAKVHPILAPNFGENPKLRPSLGGVGSGTIGRTMDSNLIEMMSDMATKGFDVQPIFGPFGKCIGIVRLNDVAGLLASDSSFEIRPGDNISRLNDSDLKLILPPPPEIDGTADLSIAGGILKHGTQAVMVNFQPDSWVGKDSELKEAKEVLAPGLHIMTSHDIIAYRLSEWTGINEELDDSE